MARIILIHGAWGNALNWVSVAPVLKAAGHTVEALDLPGHGANGAASGAIGQSTYADYVEARLLDGPPAMLVGHSMGGMVVAQVASRQPGHVTKAVFVTALLPRDGESLLGLIRQQDAPGVQAAVRPGPVPGTTVLDPSAAAALFPEATPKLAAAAMAAMSPQSNKAQMDPVQIAPGFARVPRAYVFCSQDLVVVPALQRQMVAATPCEATVTMDCGHVPQLTRAQDLAEILLGFAAA
ncbi:MAG TPA: alpha/beta fold hydrolase [Pararhodobacter sp.]|uniref:alpha/beta fold hydrolase n=1 Tax=Pararhodobacter sp. TaxID=2127056 RepID=UPI002C680BB0|nr:alpha/beta fold hydrolase [Pararhodobacter sp.]HPD91982.1 alpha/beta fold hydrolase [Pararhodobacter sp.]